MTRILMVCLGNICRSPLAEGILRAKLNHLDADVEIDSAGTGGYHVGAPPDERSVKVAGKYGINITGQRARKFTTADFDNFDHIFVMDNSNKRDVLRLARNTSDEQKVKLILDEIFPGENVDVPDPYYGGHNGFENVYKLLDKACAEIAKNISDECQG